MLAQWNERTAWWKKAFPKFAKKRDEEKKRTTLHLGARQVGGRGGSDSGGMMGGVVADRAVARESRPAAAAVPRREVRAQSATPAWDYPNTHRTQAPLASRRDPFKSAFKPVAKIGDPEMDLGITIKP